MDFTQDTQDAILAAVFQAANGNITKDELLDQLNETTGGDFRDSPDEDERTTFLADVYVAWDNNEQFEVGLEAEQAVERLNDEPDTPDQMRTVCLTVRLPLLKIESVEIEVPTASAKKVEITTT